MLEAALSLSVFLLVIGGGIEMLRYAYYGLVSQYVVTEAARFGSLGAGCPECTAAERVQKIEDRIEQHAAKFGVTLADRHICVQSDLQADCGTDNLNDSSGKPHELMAIRVRMPIHLLFGIDGIYVNAEAIAKNEPFSVQ